MAHVTAEHREMIKENEARWFDQARCWIVATETLDEDLGAGGTD